MKRILLTLSALVLFALVGYGQKKPLDHSVYDNWKNIGAINVTEDYQFALFNVNPQEGDASLVSLNLANLSQDIIQRGTSARITPDGKFAVFNIKPLFSQTREAKIKKTSQDKMPKDSLGIYNLRTKEIEKFPYLKDYKMGLHAKDFIAFQTTPPADTSSKEKPAKKDKDEGSDLIVYQLSTKAVDTLKFISDYEFSRGGDSLFVVRRPNSKDTELTAGLFLYIPKTKSLTEIYKIDLKQSVKTPYVSKDNSNLLFFAKLDTTKSNKDKFISIVHYKNNAATIIADNKVAGMPANHRISENRNIQMNDAGTRVFFGIAPILPEKDTTLVDFELAKLDIWHWNEPHVQPIQLVNLQRELRKTYLCKIELNNPRLVQLGKEEYQQIQVPDNMNAEWAYAFSNYNYRLESQWVSDPRGDLYLINVNDGSSKTLFKDKYFSNVTTSLDNKYLVWFNAQDEQWYSYEIASGNTVNITAGMNVSFANEVQDTPQMRRSYGISGWLENDAALFINDRYDVWQVDPSGKTPAINLTNGIGRKENKTFRITRLDVPQRLDREPQPITSKQRLYFSAFDNITKENGFYYKDLSRRNAAMVSLVMEPFTYAGIIKAPKGDLLAYVKSNFTNSPDVWVTKDNFKTQRKVTDINPQQRDYIWGTNELVKWTSATGKELEGILYKPDNFDPNKKYPMIVYFYETMSNTLNAYRAPAPSRSTVNISYFVSNGYLMFIPDIVYEVGQPGQDAIDCIVPGVEMLCKNSWVDKDNIAIQGQSWGGYQVAYMITKPETFKWKAAGSGAPVSNMTSAYGGIRWGSGMVRQFQYEQTQSRLGTTMWDEGGLEVYIKNSPLFFVDKVETPVLIMHNDRDDAVPWWQGIEYFTALRRLGKPAWLLQYNDEVHNLAQRVNAKDLSIRLAQFFDHYLKGAPMPVWMKTGVPATHKGIDLGTGY